MVYQYIHTIVGTAYRDMAVESPFPPDCIETVRRLSCDGSFLNQHDSEIVSYFSLGGNVELPIVVMSKTAKKINSASVGFYAQSVGWEWDGNMLLNHMSTVFAHAFYSENEIDVYAAAEANVPINMKTADLASPVNINSTAVKAVLYAVFSKWLRGGEPVKITVPEGMDYNAYILNAVKELYSYFPVGLRTEAGFCSYPTQTSCDNSRIYIVFTPQSGIQDSISLDGSSETAIEKFIKTKTGYSRLDSVVEHICTLNSEERKAFIAGIYESVEAQCAPNMEYNVTARSYLGVGSAIELIQKTGDASVLFPDWIKYYAEREKYPPFLQKSIEQTIAQKLTGEDLREYLLNSCANLSPAGIVSRFASCNDLCKLDESFAASAQKTLTALLDRSAIGDGERLELLKNNKSQLDAIVTEEMLQTVDRRIHAAQAQGFADALKNIKDIPTKTLQQIDNVEQKTHALLQELERSPVALACADVKANIEQYLAELGNSRVAVQKADFVTALWSIKNEAGDTTLPQIDAAKTKAAELLREVQNSFVNDACADVKQEIELYISELNEKSFNIQRHAFEEKFQTIHSAEAQTITQINGVLDRLHELKREIGASQAASSCDKLIADLDNYMLYLNEQKNSSATAYAEAREKVNAAESYFDAHEIIGDNLQSISTLTEDQRSALCRMADTRRPKSAKDYAKTFENCFGKPIDLAAMASLQPYLCNRVAADVCNLGVKPLSLTISGNKADELRDKTVGSIAVAKAVSNKCKATVTLDNTSCDPDVLLPLLSLTYDGDSPSAERLFYDLVNAGAYSSSQLCSACSMVRRCNWKYSKLLECILVGKFPDCSEDEYTAAYELLRRDMERRAPKDDALDAMEKLNGSLKGHGDKVACKAFDAFVSERKKIDKKSRLKEEKNERKSFLIPFIVSAALCVALAAMLIVPKLLGRGTDKSGDVTVTPSIVSITAQTPKEFFDRAFSYYSDAVKKAVLDEKNIDDYKYLYVGHQPYETMASIGEDEVSWNEYFFWYSYLCSEKGIKPGDDSLVSLKTDIEYVLNMCHAPVQPAENTGDAKNTEQSEIQISPAAPDTQNTEQPETQSLPTDFESQLESVIADARRFFGEGKAIFASENFTGDTTKKILDITIAQPAETEPVETESAEMEPAETVPAETEPVETEDVPVNEVDGE